MLTEKNIQNRKKGIGASEAGIVMGLNQHISPYHLWLIKTGQKEPDDISELPQVYWGNLHEEAIANEYEKIMNCKVRRVTNTLYHKKYPFMLCHLDRKIEGAPKVLECKFAMFARDEWGPAGSDIVPMPYIVQVQYQLAVTGYEEADLAVLIGGCDFRVYHFRREEKLIEKITEKVSEFWKCVETKTPPPLRDRYDVELAYPFSINEVKEAAPDVLSVVDKFCEIRAKTKELEKEKEKLTDALTLFMKDSEGLSAGGKIIATWKANSKGTRVLRVLEGRI